MTYELINPETGTVEGTLELGDAVRSVLGRHVLHNLDDIVVGDVGLIERWDDSGFRVRWLRLGQTDWYDGSYFFDDGDWPQVLEKIDERD